MPIQMTCQKCGNPFVAYPADAARGRKFCGAACRGVGRGMSMPVAARNIPVTFNCRECGSPFTMMQSYLDAYRKKFGRDPLYCSRPCSDLGRQKSADARNVFRCQQCGSTTTRRRKPGGRIYGQQKFCGIKCKAESQRTAALARFQAGGYKRHVKRHGYVWISVPSLVTGKKHAMLEHRYVMEQHLGRKLLPEETVHHLNGDRAFNELCNLELFSSRHGPGQRVSDKVAFAIEMLRTYPEFAAEQGYRLEPVNGAGDGHALTPPSAAPEPR